MGVTFVSISQLTAAGYAALFHNVVCHIFDPCKKLLGEVPVSDGLYHVKCPTMNQSFAGTARAAETFTMEDLHVRLSHIGPATICKMLMLAKGMVDRVKLDPHHESMGQCEPCEYAKATCKPIEKICELQHCAKFGDKVHTDLWGSSSIQ
ncbi:hypothetical protein PAXRUDRAFT_78700, partial [Paxillus rubicundulus Ve08.2h10]